jgi:hypothetical protein
MIRSIESQWKRYPLLCHPDRSEAKWRDLQFRGPLLEMFFDRVVAYRRDLLFLSTKAKHYLT